jgi:hypothetical protein
MAKAWVRPIFKGCEESTADANVCLVGTLSRKATKQYLREAPTMKIDADEKELLASVERGEWKAASGAKPERTRYADSDIPQR